MQIIRKKTIYFLVNINTIFMFDSKECNQPIITIILKAQLDLRNISC